MSQTSGDAPSFRYRVVYSELCRNKTKDLLARANAAGRFNEFAKLLRDINARLEWIPLDFGEPLRDYLELEIKEYIGVLAPLVLKYGVDEARRIVFVALPFSLLSKSGI